MFLPDKVMIRAYIIGLVFGNQTFFCYLYLNQKPHHMKKKLLIFAFLLLSAMISVQAQVEKGNWFLSGSSNLNICTYKDKWEQGTTTEERYKGTDFSIQPQIGYFIIDKLPVGLSLNFTSSSYKDLEDDDHKSTYSTISVGPFVRYYILNAKGFWPYAEAMVGFGSTKDKYTGYENIEEVDKSTLMGYRIGVGGTYFFNEYVGFDLFLGYQNETEKYKAEGEETDDSKYIIGGITFNVGFVLSL